MRGYRRALLAGTVLALVCALMVAVAMVSPGAAEAPATRAAPLAVVLAPGVERSELVVVDLDRRLIVRRIALRSLVTDIDTDFARGTVIGAQTGGIGDDADDALSIADPRSGEVRYVTLPRTDPSQVECVAGRAVVLHSWVDAAGYVVSAVDLAQERVTAVGSAPDGPGLWAAAAGSVWATDATGGAEPCALVRLDPVTLTATPVGRVGFTPSAVVPDGDAVAVVGPSLGAAAGEGSVALLDAKTGAVIATATVSGLRYGARIAVVTGGVLAVGDWGGSEPETDSLAVLDARTLASLPGLHVGRAPCALAAYDDRLLVVDRVEGALRQVDPRSGNVEWTVDLGVRDLLCSQVLVLPRGSGTPLPSDPGTGRVASR